jgi:DMSO/TMAO reductase YedYZ molybdopterin-dependent catalytic subunit
MSKERYIAAKEKWAEKQKARGVTARATASRERLPPGQKLTTGFPVLDLGIQPKISLGDWRLKLDGLVEAPGALTWEELNALPQVQDVSDFHCVTTWSKYDCRWGGVAFTTLYERVRSRSRRRASCTSRATTATRPTWPWSSASTTTCSWQRRLTARRCRANTAGPARVIIPKLYAWKGAKFVSGITFLAEDKLGFWEVRGYSNTADPWTEDRYA